MDCVDEREEEVVESGVEKKYSVPEGYLESEAEGVRSLKNRVVTAGEDQVIIDEVYEELVKMMRGGLVTVKVRSGKSSLQWFTKRLGNCRRSSMGQREWLKCGDKEAKMEKKREYVEKRRTYKKAVGRAKRSAEESRQNELESLIRSPRRCMVVSSEEVGPDGWSEREE